MSKLNELEHMADRAFRVRGETLKELFANAADALFRLQRQRAGTNFELTREVQVQGYDRETLLVNWLNEILYLQDAHNETLSRAEIIEISDQHLKAKLQGRKDRRVQRLIKAVTFHGLRVEETKTGFEAEIIVDV
jgi:SHS2 domain-containing protein